MKIKFNVRVNKRFRRFAYRDFEMSNVEVGDTITINDNDGKNQAVFIMEIQNDADDYDDHVSLHAEVLRRANERAGWIDKEILKLIPEWSVPIILKFSFLKVFTGVEIINKQLGAGFGTEVIIKKFGKIKASRKFK